MDAPIEVTKSFVAAALVRMARHMHVSIAELERRVDFPLESLQRFVENRPERTTRSISLDRALIAVNALGFETHEALIEEAAKLPPEVKPELLRNAVSQLQAERNISNQKVADGLGIKRKSYERIMSGRGGFFSLAGLAELPGVFGVQSLQDVVDETLKYEPVPPVTLLSEAIRTLQQQRKMEARDVAAKVPGWSVDDVSQVRNAKQIPVRKLRQLPGAFDCEDFLAFLDAAGAARDTRARKTAEWGKMHPRESREKLFAGIAPVPLEKDNHWKHLIEQGTLSERLGKKGPYI